MQYVAKVFDLCVLIVAFVSAGLALSNGMTFAEFMGMRIKLSNFMLFSLLLILWHYLFIVCGLYTSKRLTTAWAAIFEVCGATVLAGVVLTVLIRIFQIHLGTPKFVILFWTFCTAGMIGGRLAARSLLWLYGVVAETEDSSSLWAQTTAQSISSARSRRVQSLDTKL